MKCKFYKLVGLDILVYEKKPLLYDESYIMFMLELDNECVKKVDKKTLDTLFNNFMQEKKLSIAESNKKKYKLDEK
jgi:hypothetical protein